MSDIFGSKKTSHSVFGAPTSTGCSGTSAFGVTKSVFGSSTARMSVPQSFGTIASVSSGGFSSGSNSFGSSGLSGFTSAPTSFGTLAAGGGRETFGTVSMDQSVSNNQVESKGQFNTCSGISGGSTSFVVSQSLQPSVKETSIFSGTFTGTPSVFGTVTKSTQQSTVPSFGSISSQANIQASSVFGVRTTSTSLFSSTADQRNINTISPTGNLNVQSNIFGSVSGANPIKTQSSVFGKSVSPITISNNSHTPGASIFSTRSKQQSAIISGDSKSPRDSLPQQPSVQSTNLYRFQTPAPTTMPVTSHVFSSSQFSNSQEKIADSVAGSTAKSVGVFSETKAAPDAVKKIPEESSTAFGNKPSVFGKKQNSSVLGKIRQTSTFGIKNESDTPLQTGFQKEDSLASKEASFHHASSVFGSKKSTNSSVFDNNKQDRTKTAEGVKRKLIGENAEDDANQSRKMRIKRVERDTQDENSRGKSVFDRSSSKVYQRDGDRKQIRDTSNIPESENTRDNNRGESPQKPPFRRMSSQTEDMSSRCALVCKNVPTKFNQAVLLRKHFSKFGQVTKVFPNPRRGTATVHFGDHESAVEAKKRGQVMARGLPPMTLFWSTYSPSTKLKTQRSSEDVTEESGKISKRQWSDRNDVNEELRSMSGTSDVRENAVDILKRPDESTPSISQTYTETSVKASKDEKESLRILLGSVGKNSADCYRLLELRDKIFKMRRTKQTVLSSAKAFIGTCTDMCPEKERYEREDKRRLHIFEIIPGTEACPGQNPKVDHLRAVKEYSRSSADQEEPLAHELRPTPVLVKAMQYLLTEIADKGRDGQWGDWFDFLWNRTRSIRKDITQQQLCNRNVVELLEKCARFHIFCSARLCEEDMSDFDMKINNENLTKSLQTLKEFYYDLEVKHRCFCPNEPEFRSYIVLMNLNEGDILRDIQQLRPEIQNSPEIHFATSVYSALNSNNYVRFFRLVKDGSFLNACIMHRYFTQIRTKALLTIQKSYAVGGKPVQFRLSQIVRVLAFQDIEEAMDFCMHYGYEIIDGEVVLDRNSFIEPEQVWMPRRSQIIESKRMVSIGEVINGERLQPFSFPPVTSSFDQNGRFIGFNEDISVSDLHIQAVNSSCVTRQGHYLPSSFEEDRVVTEDTPIEISPVKEEISSIKPVSKPTVSNEVVKSLAKQLFFDVIDEFAKEVAISHKTAVDMIVRTTESLVDEITDMSIGSLIRSLCSDVYNEEVLKKQKQDQVELEERIARLSVEVLEQIMQSTVQREINEISKEVHKDVQKELKKQCIERCTVKIRDEIVAEEAIRLLSVVAEDVYQTDVVERLEELAEYEKCIQLYRTLKFFNRWRQAHSRSVKLRRNMFSFPPAPSLANIPDQVGSLLPCDKSTEMDSKRMFLNDTATMSIGSLSLLEKKEQWCDAALSAYSLLRRKKEEKAWLPLDLNRLAGPQLLRTIPDSTKTIYWKVLIALPEESENDTCILRKWLKIKFTKGSVTDNDLFSKSALLSLYRVGLHNCEERQLAVCVRSVEGTLDVEDSMDIEYSRTLFGSHGIIFLMNPLPLNASDSKYWSEEQNRLEKLLETNPLNPILPLIILTPFYCESRDILEEVQDYLHLETLIDRGLLKDVDIVPAELQRNIPGAINVASPTLNKKLHDSVQWLAEHYPKQAPLQVKYMQTFVNDFLQENFFTVVFQDLKERRNKGLLHQDPNALINLYNSCVDHLIEVASSSHLRFQSWPVTEFAVSRSKYDMDLPPFYWNREDHLHYLMETIYALVIPKFGYSNIRSEEWQSVIKDVLDFVDVITVDDTSSSQVFLKTKIRRLLYTVLEDFENTCFLTEQEVDCQPTYVNAPWTDIVCACIDYRLAMMDFCDLNCDGDDENAELMVVYEETALQKFFPSLDWKDAVFADEQKSVGFNQTMDRAVKNKRQEKETLEQTKKPNTDANVSSTEEQVQLCSPTKTFFQIMEKEKLQSQEYEEYLMKVLNSDVYESPVDGVTQTSEYSLTPGVTPLEMEVECQKQESLSIVTDDQWDTVSDYDLDEKLLCLQQDIESNKKAEELFESRLKFLLENTF